MKKIERGTFFFNTLLVILAGLIIKVLGLINRIVITRLLGTEGMSLYVLSFPTIILFINISAMSLNISTSKLVAESLKTKRYSPKKIIQKSIKLSLIVSFFTCLLFIIILKPLVNIFLKNEDLYYPLLTTLVLIPLVGISDTLKGYFNGLKQMRYSSLANLVEQIARIIFSIVCLYLMLPYGTVVATIFCLLALSIGEIASIVYSLIKIKKVKIVDFPNTNGEFKAITKITVPNTMSKLVGNFTYFLEPIIFTAILTYLSYDKQVIQTNYTIINAYTIPLLTMISFISTALSTTLVPGISENYSTGNIENVHYYIRKSLLFSIIPGILASIFLYFFAKDYMLLIYSTEDGSSLVSLYVFAFLPYYLQMPLSAILGAIGKSKQMFIFSTIFNILKLVLIATLAFIPSVGVNSMLLATAIILIIYVFVQLLTVIKSTKYKINFNNLVNTLLLFIFTFFLTKLLIRTQLSFLIISLVIGIIYLFIAIQLNLLEIASIKDLLKKKK